MVSVKNAAAGRQRCEVWTRVMGYFRPLSNFNEGKKSEHCSREFFLPRENENTRFAREYGGVARGSGRGETPAGREKNAERGT